MFRRPPVPLWRIHRRCGFRGFVLTLCAVYFTAMYVFQSGLDTNHQNPGMNADGDDSVRRWAHIGGDEFEEPLRGATGRVVERKPLKRGAVDWQEEFENIRNVEQREKQQRRDPQLEDDKDIPVARQWMIRDPVPADDVGIDVGIPPSCSYNTEDLEFIALRDVFLYSAFWDVRSNDFDNEQNGTIVRLMAVIRSNSRPHLKCLWSTADGADIFTDVTYYEMSENHGRPYGSFILSCRAPDHVTNVPCNVTVMADDMSMAQVPVRTLRPPPGGKSMNKFTVCVPPLFGAVSTTNLVEFLELTFVLGADRIVIYEYNVPIHVHQLLDRYSTIICGSQATSANKRRSCRLDVIPWRLPAELDAGMWYHGQSIAIHDCLYRHMPVSHYVLFNDIDEFVVPHGEEMSNWIDVADHLWTPDRCALQFISAFFDDRSFSPDESRRQSPGEMKLMTMSVLKRSKDFSAIRTKCMVKPYEIFEAGIHHISKPIWASLEVHRVDADVAYLHHYRTCLANMGMNCGGAVNDTSMLRYQEVLQRTVNDSWTLLSSNYL